MSRESTITSHDIEVVRSKIETNLNHPINGKFFKHELEIQIQRMIGWRIQKQMGYHDYPDDPDSSSDKSMIYNQLACELYRGRIIKAHSIWETHDDLRARGEIPSTDFRVSGDVFFLRNLPQVPVIRCDATPKQSELALYKKQAVLIDYNLKVL